MSNAQASASGSELLATGPARDARFSVAGHWVECANFPPGHPQRDLEFLHRQMNEEVDSLECCAVTLSDFPQEPWELRLGMARQCADEARHADMYRRLYESRGGYLGQFPILDFQYRIVATIHSLIGRIAVQNRCFEAGGLDAIAVGIDDARLKGDQELAELFESQRADEIIHVRFANEWIRIKTQKDPRAVLEIGAALRIASKAFAYVMGPEGTAGAKHPADVSGRQEAGFTENEVQMAIHLQQSR